MRISYTSQQNFSCSFQTIFKSSCYECTWLILCPAKFIDKRKRCRSYTELGKNVQSASDEKYWMKVSSIWLKYQAGLFEFSWRAILVAPFKISLKVPVMSVPGLILRPAKFIDKRKRCRSYTELGKNVQPAYDEKYWMKVSSIWLKYQAGLFETSWRAL